MKKLTLIILLVNICFALFAQNKEITILKNEVLNGRVKILYERHISDNFNDSSKYYFNELGLNVSKESSSFSGLNIKAVYTYDKDNKIRLCFRMM